MKFVIERRPEGFLAFEWSNGDRSYGRGTIAGLFIKFYINRIRRRKRFDI